MIDQFLQFCRHSEWNFSLCQTLNQSIEHFGDCRYFDCYTQLTFDSANTTPTKSIDKKRHKLHSVSIQLNKYVNRANNYLIETKCPSHEKRERLFRIKTQKSVF